MNKACLACDGSKVDHLGLSTRDTVMKGISVLFFYLETQLLILRI